MRKAPKKVYIYTMGCHRRLLDARKILDYLKINGHKITRTPGKADYILLNTCAFKEIQENFAIKKIQEFKKYGKKLIVCGCLPKINEKRLKDVFDGPAFSPSTMEEIDNIFRSKIKFKDLADANFLSRPYFFGLTHLKDFFQLNYKFFALVLETLKAKLKGNYYIRISWGCLGKCSYCGIRNAIGPFKSKPVQECLKEFKKGVSRGYKNFTIVADDVGAYGLDVHETFPGLLNKFLKIRGKYKFYIFELHPRWVIRYLEQLTPIVKLKKIYSIMCPIQSGSDRILGLMQRFYTAEETKKALLNLKKAYPKLRLVTQIIVGFPGETEEDFDKTLEFLKEVKFDYVVVYPYYERSNTPAVALPNKISQDIIKERTKKAKKTFARS